MLTQGNYGTRQTKLGRNQTQGKRKRVATRRRKNIKFKPQVYQQAKSLERECYRKRKEKKEIIPIVQMSERKQRKQRKEWPMWQKNAERIENPGKDFYPICVMIHRLQALLKINHFQLSILLPFQAYIHLMFQECIFLLFQAYNRLLFLSINSPPDSSRRFRSVSSRLSSSYRDSSPSMFIYQVIIVQQHTMSRLD